MAVIRINRNPADWQLRLFACMPAAAGSLAAAWLGPAHWTPLTVGLACGAGLLAVSGLVRPSWIRPLYGVALMASLPLTWAVSHLIMIALYFGVITPIALVLRALGHDPLGRRQRTPPGWRSIAGERTAESSFRQW
jgi:hypothetical protein